MTEEPFTPYNLSETYSHRIKENYTGYYEPESFWAEMGKYYLKTFISNSKEESDTKDEDEFKLNSKGSRLELNAQQLIARLRALNPIKILEVGCGFGRLIPFIIGNVPSVEELIGVEFSSTMIENSKLYLKHYDTQGKTKIIQGDARDLPFEGKHFDTTYTHVCLTHIPPKYIDKVTREISRVTKKWIVHIERFAYLYEHPNPHRWSHMIIPHYLNLGWKVHEYDEMHKEHKTKILVLKKEDI